MDETMAEAGALRDFECDLSGLVSHPEINTRVWIPPVIMRCAQTKREWARGSADFELHARLETHGTSSRMRLRLSWNVDDLARRQQCATVYEELRKLKGTLNERAITEQAALGVGFLLVRALLPRDRVTSVVQIGGRGDFFLNGRRDEMIEFSGTIGGDLFTLLRRKREQILCNARISRAWVNVSRFARPSSLFERVR